VGKVVVVVRMRIRTRTRGEGAMAKKTENRAIMARFWVDLGHRLGVGGSVVVQGPLPR
jgi:hypothetical protein